MVTGFIGLNGSGKTTTMRLIPRWAVVAGAGLAGCDAFAGRDVRHWYPKVGWDTKKGAGDEGSSTR
jgi:signal recognition particle GTPase